AILYTGPRRVVLVDLGGGRLGPREVKVGAQTGDRTEVLSGLAEGDAVVTAGNFMIAAESRIRSSGTFWKEAPCARTHTKTPRPTRRPGRASPSSPARSMPCARSPSGRTSG